MKPRIKLVFVIEKSDITWDYKSNIYCGMSGKAFKVLLNKEVLRTVLLSTIDNCMLKERLSVV